MERIVRPGVARILSGQLSPNGRIVANPEASQVTRHLNRSLIGGQQVQDQEDPPTADGGALCHPEKILQPGFDPGWVTWLVVDFQ